jgi:SAM-dependent methyltransferase
VELHKKAAANPQQIISLKNRDDSSDSVDAPLQFSKYGDRDPIGLVRRCECQQCRICGSSDIINRGNVEFYFEYEWPIFDCNQCGCRFTLHDESTYDLLYSEKSSCYNRYLGQADICKRLFELGDSEKLRAALSGASKYRFIIDELDQVPRAARILEIGSSRGHLTSYFILTGRDITGIDVSPNAIAAASVDFGNYFVLAGDSSIEGGAPYDVIFHVGTIGCVAAPIAMTQSLLSLLKTGGRLLFNAPNRDGLSLRNQLWFDSAPPPDVVTLFPPGFWRDHFCEIARVRERIESCSYEQSFVTALRRLAGRGWRQPIPMPLKQSEQLPAPPASLGDMLWRQFERVARKVARTTGLGRLCPWHPSEYGLFVEMVKK